MDKNLTHRDRATDLGAVRINNNAIMSIASIAAMEIRGVYKIGGGIRRTLYDLFKKVGTKGVSIQMKDSEVKLTISIVVEYGIDIPRLADEVQESVKRAVEKMAGLALSEVDVIIEGVHLPGSSEKKNKEGVI
jgi:uncharacterized alkaline shock family protein YloU